MTRHCDSCEVLFINGVKCHERGCPDAWRDSVRSCKECGTDFKPEERGQVCCDASCAMANIGAYYDDMLEAFDGDGDP